MPNGYAKNQIDFIVIPYRFRNAVKFCKAITGADAGSNRIPVISNIRIKLKTLIKKK